MQKLLLNFYWVPVLLILLVILLKYRQALAFKPGLFKKETGAGKAVYLPLLAIMAMLFTFALTLPLSYDESYTFNEFTYNGFWASISTYPIPNNHVFHSLLTNISWKILGFSRSELAIRLPALCFTAFTLYFVFAKYLEANIYSIVLFSLLFLFSPNIIEYAFQARGYSIQICCGVVSYYFAGDARGIKSFSFRERFNVVMLFSAAGMFTSPAYLYTAGTVCLIFLIVNFRQVRKDFLFFTLVSVFYGLTVVLLYTPIIVTQGLHKIINNPFVTPIDYFNFDFEISKIKELVKYVTLPNDLSWIVVILFLWNTVRQKAYYNLLLVFIPAILMFVLKQLPFNRVFLPIGAILLVNATMAISCSDWFKKITAARSSCAHHLTALLIVSGASILSYIYFNDVHIKDDLLKAYKFRKVASAISGHKKVYTKDLNSSWDLLQILWAHMKLKNIEGTIELEKDLKQYIFKSSLILSSQPLSDFRIIDSTEEFEGKTLLIIDPKQ
jgi:hypothetical protein